MMPKERGLEGGASSGIADDRVIAMSHRNRNILRQGGARSSWPFSKTDAASKWEPGWGVGTLLLQAEVLLVQSPQASLFKVSLAAEDGNCLSLPEPLEILSEKITLRTRRTNGLAMRCAFEPTGVLSTPTYLYTHSQAV